MIRSKMKTKKQRERKSRNGRNGRKNRKTQKGGGIFNRAKSFFTRKGKVAPAPVPQNMTVANAVAGTRPITQKNEFKFNYQMSKRTTNANLNLGSEPLIFETFRQIIPESDHSQQYFYLRVIPKSAKVSLKKFPTNPFLQGINSRPNMPELKSYIINYLTNYYKPIMDKFGDFGPMTAENLGNIFKGWKNNLTSSLHALKKSIPGKVDAHVRNVVDKNAPRFENVLYNNTTAWKNEGENISEVTHTFPITQGEYELGSVQQVVNLEFVMFADEVENILPPISWLGSLSAEAFQKLMNTFPQVPEEEFLIGSEKEEIVNAMRKRSAPLVEEEEEEQEGEDLRPDYQLPPSSRTSTVASNPRANSYSMAAAASNVVGTGFFNFF